jgi:hypothetical protein
MTPVRRPDGLHAGFVTSAAAIGRRPRGYVRRVTLFEDAPLTRILGSPSHGRQRRKRKRVSAQVECSKTRLRLPSTDSDDDLMRIGADNPGYRFEREEDGSLIVSPTSTKGGAKSGEAFAQLYLYEKRVGGKAYDRSTGFAIGPQLCMYSPDASWVSQPRVDARRGRWTRTVSDPFAPMWPLKSRRERTIGGSLIDVGGRCTVRRLLAAERTAKLHIRLAAERSSKYGRPAPRVSFIAPRAHQRTVKPRRGLDCPQRYALRDNLDRRHER